MQEILAGYVADGDSTIGPDGLIYECPTRDNVVHIIRRNADGSETVIRRLDDPKQTGKDAAATMQFLPGTGDLIVMLSTRNGAGDQVWADVPLPGICAPPDVVLDVYRGTYKSNAEITSDGLLWLRLERQRAAIVQLQETAIRIGHLRKA